MFFTWINSSWSTQINVSEFMEGAGPGAVGKSFITPQERNILDIKLSKLIKIKNKG